MRLSQTIPEPAVCARQDNLEKCPRKLGRCPHVICFPRTSIADAADPFEGARRPGPMRHDNVRAERRLR